MSINISDIDTAWLLNMTTWEFIEYMGTPLHVDLLYLYPTLILGVIGTILNTFCVIVYFKKEFNNPMFYYFKIFSICCLILTATGVPYSLCMPIRFVKDENRKICCYYLSVWVAIGSTITYYCSVLDIAILLDRLRTFNNTVKKYFKLTPQMNCLVLGITCLAVNGFYITIFVPQEFYWYNYLPDGTIQQKSIWYSVVAEWGASRAGYIFVIITYFFRELVVIVFSIAFSIILLIYMRNYFKNKAKMAKKPKIDTASAGDSSKTQTAQQSSAKQMSNAEEKFLQLVIVQCTLTIITRTSFFGSSVTYLFRSDAFAQTWSALSDLFIFFNATVCFFIYFFFNKLFKKEFLKLFNINIK